MQYIKYKYITFGSVESMYSVRHKIYAFFADRKFRLTLLYIRVRIFSKFKGQLNCYNMQKCIF